MNLEIVAEYWPTQCFSVLMLMVFILKRLPKLGLTDDNHGYLLMFSAAITGVSALFSVHYWSSLIIHITLYIWGCSMCLKVDVQSDPSAGAVGLFYAFILMIGVGISVIGKTFYTAFIA